MPRSPQPLDPEPHVPPLENGNNNHGDSESLRQMTCKWGCVGSGKDSRVSCHTSCVSSKHSSVAVPDNLSWA